MTEMTQIKRRIEVAAQEAAAEMDLLAEDNRGLRGFIERVRNAACVDHGVDLVGFVAAMHAVYVREHAQPQPPAPQELVVSTAQVEAVLRANGVDEQRIRSVITQALSARAPDLSPEQWAEYQRLIEEASTPAPQPAAEASLGLVEITTFASPLNADVRHMVYDAEAHMVEQNPSVRFDFHLRDAAALNAQPAAGGGGEVLTDAQIEEIATEHAGEYHSLALMLIREALLRARLREGA